MTLAIDKLVSQALEQGAEFDIAAAFATLSETEKRMLALEGMTARLEEEVVAIFDDEMRVGAAA